MEMVRKGLVILALLFTLTMLPPGASDTHAAIPAPCPLAPPGVGGTVFTVSASLPGTALSNANGVCIDLVGTNGT